MDRLSKNDIPVSKFVPYAYHLDDNTLVTKSGSLIQIFKIEGIPNSTNSVELLEQFKHSRNELLKTLSDERLSIFTHSIRKRVKVSLSGDFSGVSKDINTQWQKRLNRESLYVTDHYFTLVRDSHFGATKAFRDFFSSLSMKKDKKSWTKEKEATKKKLEQDALIVKSAFSEYNPTRLSVYKDASGLVSEPLTLLHYMLNGDNQNRLLPRMDLSKFLPTSRPLFGREIFELRAPTSSKYGAIFGIKEYPAESEVGHFDELFKLKQEFILTQTFEFVSKQSAKNLINQVKTNLVQSEDDSESQRDELSIALDDLASNRIRFGEYNFVLSVMSDSENELNEAIEEVYRTLLDANVAITREDINLEAAFWAQFPGNGSYGARKVPITTGNFSGFASFHAEPRGQKDHNRWGDYVTVLPTENGSPYYFNWHMPIQSHVSDSNDKETSSDKGHTKIIGPNGTGKTALMTFLLSQSSKFGGRIIYFDKDRASEIFIRSLGGEYSVIRPGVPSGLNPLQLKDTAVNRAFLFDWFSILLKESGDLTTVEKEQIDALIEGNYSLDYEHRRLSNIAPFLIDATFSKRLKPWLKEGRDGYLFDNEFDVLNLSQDCFGVDFSHLLTGDNAAARTAATYYFFHRLNESLDGRPTLVPFDEGWAYLNHPFFENNIQDLLKTIRKKEGVVIFATQDPVDTANSNINSTLNQEISTEIYFANRKGKKEHYCDEFELSEVELDLVKSMNPAKRNILLKQGNQSVILDVYLGDEMSTYIPILSGRKETVEILDELRNSVGNDPEDWLPKFIKSINRKSEIETAK